MKNLYSYSRSQQSVLKHRGNDVMNKKNVYRGTVVENQIKDKEINVFINNILN